MSHQAQREIAVSVGLTMGVADNQSKEEWRNAYEAVAVPDAVRRVGEEIQAAFGRDVRFVAPTAAGFKLFNGFTNFDKRAFEQDGREFADADFEALAAIHARPSTSNTVFISVPQAA